LMRRYVESHPMSEVRRADHDAVDVNNMNSYRGNVHTQG